MGQLGLDDKANRLAPTLVEARTAFGGLIDDCFYYLKL